MKDVTEDSTTTHRHSSNGSTLWSENASNRWWKLSLFLRFITKYSTFSRRILVLKCFLGTTCTVINLTNWNVFLYAHAIIFLYAESNASEFRNSSGRNIFYQMALCHSYNDMHFAKWKHCENELCNVWKLYYILYNKYTI